MNSLLMWNAAASIIKSPERDKNERLPLNKCENRGGKNMLEYINWNTIHQNLIDTWIPLFGMVLLCLVAFIWYKKKKLR